MLETGHNLLSRHKVGITTPQQCHPGSSGVHWFQGWGSSKDTSGILMILQCRHSFPALVAGTGPLSPRFFCPW